jgi:hypothetical protein
MIELNRRSNDKKVKRTPLSYVLWVVAILFMVGWLRIGWVLFYPYEPLIVHEEQKIMNKDKRILAGDDVIMESYFTKNTDAAAVVQRMFVNKFVYYLTPYTVSLPAAKNKRIIVPPIPSSPTMAPGKYRLYTTYTYPVSSYPERFVTVPAWSEEFEIYKHHDEADEVVKRKKR